MRELAAGLWGGADVRQPGQRVVGKGRLVWGQPLITTYAKSKGLAMDKSQVQPVGVGIREPFVAKPVNMDEARKNMRVEFRIIRVAAEAAKPADFDF